jgi:periplasmic copper chaperone A
VLPGANSGAAFMVIENHSMTDDRLIGVLSRVAQKTELHTNKVGTDGMTQMPAVPEGFAIPGSSSIALSRGGDHIMFMGLSVMPADGDSIPVTLIFEHAGEVTLDIPVDNKRREDAPTGGTDEMQGMSHEAAPADGSGG